jgi:hypothetical protein
MTASSEEYSAVGQGTRWTILGGRKSTLRLLFSLTGKPWIFSWSVVVLAAIVLGVNNVAHLLLSLAGSIPSFPGSARTAADIIAPTPDAHHHHHHHPHAPLCEVAAPRPRQPSSSPNPQFLYSLGYLPVSLPDDMIMSAPAISVEGIAREFEYPADQVQRGVKEFIREIHEGLSTQGATLSQIPTYVTSVPNGTEKVCHLDGPSRVREISFFFFVFPCVNVSIYFIVEIDIRL